MRNNSHQVGSLAQCGVYFLPLYVAELVDATETEAADGAVLVEGRNVEHLVDKIGSSQFFILLH